MPRLRNTRTGIVVSVSERRAASLPSHYVPVTDLDEMEAPSGVEPAEPSTPVTEPAEPAEPSTPVTEPAEPEEPSTPVTEPRRGPGRPPKVKV